MLKILKNKVANKFVKKVAEKGAEVGLGVVQKKAKNDKVKKAAGKALDYLNKKNLE